VKRSVLLVIALALVAAVALPATAGAASGNGGGITTLTASCAGDTVHGTVAVEKKPAVVTLTLEVSSDGKKWKSANRSTTVNALVPNRAYTYTISVAGMKLRWFRVDANGSHVSHQVAAGTCAPPPQVPEAPVALALPASLLLTLGAVGLVRRRRGAAGAPA
jgi:hypothetical protein